jgi:hypothetical protein
MSIMDPPGIKKSSTATQSILAREREVDEIIVRWDNGEPADALEVLRSRPHLARSKSAVVILAYEEFCQRVELGEIVDQGSFIAKFPEFGSAVEKVLLYHRIGLDDPRQPRRLENGDSFLEGLKVVELLGRGAFSRVYLANETHLASRPVVL